MTPSTALRLQSMMRSMTESILPALDPHDSLALEQAKLMIGHLHALLEQQGREQQIQAHEKQHLVTLARLLANHADGGEQTQTALAAVSSALAEDNMTTLSLATERLAAATDASPAFDTLCWSAVLEYATAAAARGKAWFKPMGF